MIPAFTAHAIASPKPPTPTLPHWAFLKLISSVVSNQVTSVVEQGRNLIITLSPPPHQVVTSTLPSGWGSSFSHLLASHHVSLAVVANPTAAAASPPLFYAMGMYGIFLIPLMLFAVLMAFLNKRKVDTSPTINKNNKGTANLFPGHHVAVLKAPEKSSSATDDKENQVSFGSKVKSFFRQVFNRPTPAPALNASADKATAPVVVPVTFKDVGGIDEVRAELEEIVDFLRAPERYEKFHAAMPKGILLSGSPGTGKTLLAKAVAGEADVNFIAASGSQFVEMYVGVGASRIRDTFAKARESAPCVLFIDEIDAVGKRRSHAHGGNDERDNTLNQLLTEMDGFHGNGLVLVMAATNRPELLDEALLRPGRFDRQVMVHAPDVRGRETILRIHTREMPLDKNVSLGDLARQTTGFVGADLKNLVNEAAIWAARHHQEAITKEALHEAFEKMVLGPVRNVLMTPDDKERTAYHEAGHALMGLLTPGADPVTSISILPRGRSLGVTIFCPEQDRHLYKFREVEAQVLTAMGGRVAEEIRYHDDISTGASDDMSKASKLVRRMVNEWGMSDLGPTNFQALDAEVAQQGQFGRAVSEETANAIDRQVSEKMNSLLAETRAQLHAHRHDLEKLAKALVERETMTSNELYELIKVKNPSRMRVPIPKPKVEVLSFPHPDASYRPADGRRRLFWRRGETRRLPEG